MITTITFKDSCYQLFDEEGDLLISGDRQATINYLRENNLQIPEDVPPIAKLPEIQQMNIDAANTDLLTATTTGTTVTYEPAPEL